jgi:O-antigen/teichoic acid export membrane protein
LVALVITRNLVLVPVYLRFVPVEEYGAWLATGAVFSYLVLSDFGLSGVVMQASGSAYGAGDKRSLGTIAGTGLLSSVALFLGLSVLVAALAPFVPAVMELEGELSKRLARCFLIAGVSNSVGVVSLTAASVLRGLQRPKLPGFVEIFSELFGICVTLVLLFRGWGLYSIALGPAFSSVAALLVNVAACLRCCLRDLAVPLRFEKGTFQRIWHGCFYLLVTGLAIRLQGRADTFFVGWILGAQAAAQYGLTIRAHEAVLMIAASLGGAVLPSLAHLYGDRDPSKFRKTIDFTVGLYAWLSSVGMATVLAWNEEFVSLWVGRELFGGMALTALMALHGILVTVGSGYYGALFAGGRFGNLAKVLLEAAVIRMALTVCLVRWGLWGAGTAAAVGGLFQLFGLGRTADGLLGTVRGERLRMAGRVMQIISPPIVLSALALWIVPNAHTWYGFALSAGGFALAAAGASLLLSPPLRRALLEEARAFRFSGTTAVGHVRLGGPE